MSKGNFLDIMISTVFVAFWTLLLRGSNIPLQNVIFLWLLFLAFNIFAALFSKRAMKNEEKSKATKHDVWRFLFSMSWETLLIEITFIHSEKWALIVIILYTNFLLLGATLMRAGLKIEVSHSVFTGNFFKKENER